MKLGFLHQLLHILAFDEYLCDLKGLSRFMNKLIIIFLLLFIIINNINADENISLTHKEKEFIKNHPIIKVGNDRFWSPFDFYEDNQAKGFSVDYLKELGNISGLKFEFIQAESWEILVDKLKNKKLDMLTALEPTLKTKKFALFSDDILVTFESMITQKKHSNLNSYKDLYGKKVGIIKGYDVEDEIKENHKQINMVLFNTPVNALQALSNSKVDVVIENSSVALYLINKYFISNLKLNGAPKFPNLDDGDKIKIVSRIDYPELHSIIQKSIKAMSTKKKKDLKNRWMSSIKNIEENKITLTKEEKDFFKLNNKFSVHMENDYTPFSNIDKNGKFVGYSIDYANMVASKLGIKFIYNKNEDWNQAISNLKTKKIDIIAQAINTKERQKFALFTKDYMTYNQAIIVKNKNLHLNTFENLKNHKIGIVGGYNVEKIIRKFYPEINFVTYANNDILLKAILLDKIDAAISTHQVMQYHINSLLLKNITSIPIFNNLHIDKTTEAFAIRDDLVLLHSSLQKAFDSVTQKEKSKLQLKWFGQTTKRVKNKVTLSKEEEEYLKNKKVINLCIDPKWLPFEEFNKENKYIGMSADYFKIFKNNIGSIDIKTIQTQTWNESLTLIKQKKCDIISLAMQTPKRDKYLNFTTTYLENPLVIATKLDIPFINDFSSVKGRKIGITKSYAFDEILKTQYPYLDIVTVKNIEDGLKKVNDGDLFGYIGALATIGYQLQTKFIGELKITGKLDEKLELRIGVRDDDEVLLSILQKAVDSVEENQKLKIKNSWLLINYEKEIDYTLIYKILFVVSIIALFVIYRQILLKKQNNELLKLSNIDPLTGAYNRRYLYSISKELIALTKREKKHLSIAMIDIDDFKKVNDTYGHNVGDEVIKIVVNTIKSATRSSDLSIRFGGEEFVILFPNTNIEQSAIVLEKVRKSIEQCNLIDNLSFTVSMGVSEFIYNEDNIEKAIKRADERLYISKNSGKNRVSK